ncbi:MAG: SCP2 sterol-binding domain-containing protein [Alphaproteobacteria bacterium]
MSEALEEAAKALREKFADADFAGSVKFDIEDEGAILVAGGEVGIEDSPGGNDADVTISAALDTFRDIFDGALSPTAAYMTGRMRIDGDMGMAMKLSQILG